MARPRKHDRAAVMRMVCERIAQGERVHAACAAEGIRWSTLWVWKQNEPEFAALYARAREASAESWEDAATRYAEEATPETVQVARLREDNARWRASVANPRKFGPKLDVSTDVTHTLGVVILPAIVHREPVIETTARRLLNAGN